MSRRSRRRLPRMSRSLGSVARSASVIGIASASGVSMSSGVGSARSTISSQGLITCSHGSSPTATAIRCRGTKTRVDGRARAARGAGSVEQPRSRSEPSRAIEGDVDGELSSDAWTQRAV